MMKKLEMEGERSGAREVTELLGGVNYIAGKQREEGMRGCSFLCNNRSLVAIFVYERK